MTTERGPQSGLNSGVRHSVVKHEGHGSTVVTSAPAPDGRGVSLSYTHIPNDINAESLETPVEGNQREIVGMHRGMLITQTSDGKIRLSSMPIQTVGK